ncbi:MAG: B12-binding domain-containing radical SAM protein [Rhodospirillales bacterium]|nr:B12-binding domain-containing radical SAM protein [Rhodospirillales bacterium]
MPTKTFTFICLYNHQSIGVRTLCSILRDRGWNYNLIFLKPHIESIIREIPSEEEIQLAIDKVIDLNSDYVGLQVFSSFIELASILTERIQALGIPVFWGGPHPTVMPDDAISTADMIFMGESEHSFIDFIERTEKGEDLSTIAGSWHRQGDKITKNAGLHVEQNLDLFPFPYFDNEHTYYIGDGTLSPYTENYKFYVMMTARGCAYSCTYCVNSFLRKEFGNKGFVRARSVDNCIQELEEMVGKYPIDHIYFSDEIFGTQKKWVREFAPKYKEKIYLPFCCLFHPNTVKEDVVSILKDAGLSKVGMGLESGSKEIIGDLYDRRTTTEKMLKACNLLNKYGIRVAYDIILDSPYDTEKTLSDTLDLLLKIPKPFILSAFSLTPFAGSALTQKMLDDGYITEDDIEGNVKTRRSKAVWAWRANDKGLRKFDSYWNGLILLCGSTRFPNWIIKMLARMRFLKYLPSFIWRVVKAKDIMVKKFGENTLEIKNSSADQIFSSPFHLRAVIDDQLFKKPVNSVREEDIVFREQIATTENGQWKARGRASSPFTYLVKGKYQPQKKGRYLIAEGKLLNGGFTLGLLHDEEWLQKVSVVNKGSFKIVLEVPNDDTYAVTLANNLSEGSLQNDFTIDKIGWLEDGAAA